nr:histidine phosphatase family protein [uncultured Carboxylicivirga sp.]
MIDFWLIRHGETEENAAGICQGQTPGTLSSIGKLQAQAVGEVLKDESFDLFYSSDLKRTMESMQAITLYHNNQAIIPEPLLRERYLAGWQGKPFPKNWDMKTLPEGAETAQDLIHRAKAFIKLILVHHQGKKIAAMSHGGLIRAFWTVLHGYEVDSYHQWESPKNTSFSRFKLMSDGSVKIIFINKAEHISQIQLSSSINNQWQL